MGVINRVFRRFIRLINITEETRKHRRPKDQRLLFTTLRIQSPIYISSMCLSIYVQLRFSSVK
jgi:hypothetical protein